jgi:NIMA-interacting peptidyl-prolyl cis-trans isomerase 1
MSKSKGIPYYFNPTTKQSSWDVPAEISEEQIQSLPGAHYLSGGSSGGAGTITASHLLVKHKDSRRPSSWKEVCMHLPGHT